MATRNVFDNEPSDLWTVGSMFPGHIDRMFPIKLGTDIPTHYKAHETWVTGNQLIEVPGNTDNEIA
jgi:hypothetical protein